MTPHTSQSCDLDVASAYAALKTGELTSVELVQSVLQRAEETEPQIHAYVTIDTDSALSAAEQRDQELKQGQSRGSLHGIPVAIKDIFDVYGQPTRCGSQSREHAAPAQRDSDAVCRLRDAGAVILGKTVTHEFAAGVVSSPARNPWDPARIPGGSSGGSAAAVAAGSAMAALGSDTGGSIRIPSSVCGVVGLKTTYGLLSKNGLYPLSWSLDTVGPLARTVREVSIVFDTLLGRDAVEPAALSVNSSYRLGISRKHFFNGIQPGVVETVQRALEVIAKTGFTLVDIDWDDAAAAWAAGMLILWCESAGVHHHAVMANPHLYGREFVLRVKGSSLFPAAGYLDALKARTFLRASVARLFSDHCIDALIAPATPATALSADDPVVRYPDGSAELAGLAYTRLTMPFNLTGQPALSIPCGLDEQGLPVGMQIAGRPFAEQTILKIGAQFERCFHERFGPGWSNPRFAERNKV